MAKIDTQNLKGVNDFVSEEQLLRSKITDILRDSFERYGYEQLESAILCKYDLLSYKYENNSEILQEIYSLTDQGNRKLGLRYDLTVPFCKVIANDRNLLMPFRRYEIGRVFRNGPVKLGREREFYQCDADVVGIDNRFIEVEQMCLVTETFEKLGIDVVIKWNNRKIMSGLLIEAGVSENRVAIAVGIIDKLEKVSDEELRSEFLKNGFIDDEYQKIIKQFSLSLAEYIATYANSNNELLADGLNEAKEIQEMIGEIPILQEKTVFTPSLARGLNIYTGIVFEFFDKKKRLSSSLGGGGRYNKIITDFIDDGQLYPAVGLSFGLEPIFAILKNDGVLECPIDVYIIPMGTDIKCLEIATEFRKNGIRTIIEMNGRKVKKCFEYANKRRIKFVVVVGEDEVAQGVLTVKNMQSGEQQQLDISGAISLINT